MRNGQDVSVDVSINTLHPFAANHVKLVEQTLTGVVSNYTAGTGGAATFTLTVPVDSVFALLNGNVNTTIDVFQQPTTLLAGITAVANGNTVRPRGLLYFDTVSGRYKLVCDRILAP